MTLLIFTDKKNDMIGVSFIRVAFLFSVVLIKPVPIKSNRKNKDLHQLILPNNNIYRFFLIISFLLYI
jgi:hypothetical protein